MRREETAETRQFKTAGSCFYLLWQLSELKLSLNEAAGKKCRSSLGTHNPEVQGFGIKGKIVLLVRLCKMCHDFIWELKWKEERSKCLNYADLDSVCPVRNYIGQKET